MTLVRIVTAAALLTTLYCTVVSLSLSSQPECNNRVYYSNLKYNTVCSYNALRSTNSLSSLLCAVLFCIVLHRISIAKYSKLTGAQISCAASRFSPLLLSSILCSDCLRASTKAWSVRSPRRSTAAWAKRTCSSSSRFRSANVRPPRALPAPFPELLKRNAKHSEALQRKSTSHSFINRSFTHSIIQVPLFSRYIAVFSGAIDIEPLNVNMFRFESLPRREIVFAPLNLDYCMSGTKASARISPKDY